MVLLALGSLALGTTAGGKEPGLALLSGAGGADNSATVTRLGPGRYSILWNVPELEIDGGPLVALADGWTLVDEKWSLPIDDLGFGDKLKGAVDEMVGSASDCLPTEYFDLMDTSFSLSAKASYSMEVSPLADSRMGHLRVDAEVRTEAAAAAPGTRGGSVTLHADATLRATQLEFTGGYADGGRIGIHGEVKAEAQVRVMGQDLTPLTLANSKIDYSLKRGEEKELNGSGIYLHIGRFAFRPSSCRNKNELSDEDPGYIYSVTADLDKLLLLYLKRRCTKGANDKTLSQAEREKQKRNAERISEWLNHSDDGLGGTLETPIGTLDFDIVDDELRYYVHAKREASVVQPEVLGVRYDFDPPVELEWSPWPVTRLRVRGDRAETIIPEPEPVLGICYANFAGTRIAYACVKGYWQPQVKHVAHATPATVIIPRTCRIDRITVTPTMEIRIRARQALQFVGRGELHREVGSFELDVKELTLPGFSTCGLKIPYPCGWNYDCRGVWKAKVCWPTTPKVCWKAISLPSYTIDKTLGPWTLGEFTAWESSNQNLATIAGVSSVVVEIPLEPFEIVVKRPELLTRLSIRSSGPHGGGCGETSCSNEWYSAPGHRVEVFFAGHVRNVSGLINGRKANVHLTRRSDGAYDCTVSRVLDVADPDGLVTFEVQYEGQDADGNWIPGYEWETGDGSCVWNARTSPDAPSVRWCTVVDSWPEEITWEPARDSSGRPAEKYQVTGTITTKDGEKRPFDDWAYCDPRLSIASLVSSLDSRAPFSIKWKVRAADRLGRWSLDSDEACLSYVEPVRFTSVNIHSSKSLTPACAERGDNVVLRFTTSVPLEARPWVTINGRWILAEAESTRWGTERESTEWKVERALDMRDPFGVVRFEVMWWSMAPGCRCSKYYGTEQTTDGSSVTLLESPVKTAAIFSSNPINPKYAERGDEAILAFTTGADLQTPPSVAINGVLVDVEGAGTRWQATHELGASDPVGPVRFRIECPRVLPPSLFEKCSPIAEVTTTTDGSSVILIEPLDPPVLTYPEDGAKITAGSTVRSFSWTAYDAAGWLGPELIKVEMIVDGSLPPIVKYTSGYLTCSTSDFAPAGSTVIWRVCAKDHLGRWGSYSDERTLYIIKELLVEINQSEWQLDPTREEWISFAVEFSQDDYIPDFDASDVLLGGTADASIAKIMWEPVFGVFIGGMTRPGTVIPSIPAGAFKNENGIPNEASTSVDNVVTFDNRPPAVSVSQEIIADADSGGTFTVRVEYPMEMDPTASAGVSSVGISFDPNVWFSGSLSFVDGAWSDANTVYTAAFAIADMNELAAGVDVTVWETSTASGLWMEGNLEADLFSIDTENPTVLISASAERTSETPIEFTATFSEPAKDLEASDFIVTNGAVSSLEAADETTYTVLVEPSAAADVTLELPAGTASDLAGNASVASNVATVVYEPPAELVEISISTSNPSGEYCTAGDTVTVAFTASGDLSGLPEVEIGRCDADVTYEGSNEYTATCEMDASSDEGEIEFEIAFEDELGNAGTADETTDGTYVIFDSEPPGFNDCPDDITSTDATVPWDEPTAWDNYSGIASVTRTHDPGDTFPIGTTTVTYTATDKVGLTSECSFDVTVEGWQ